MNEPFDLNLLEKAYGYVKDQGMALQKQGLELVRVADSGISNIAPLKTLVSTVAEISQENPTAKPFLDFLYESGKHAFLALNSAAAGIQISIPILENTVAAVTATASANNIAVGTVATQLLSTFPEKRDALLATWPPQGLARSFDEAELDAYLQKFDPELPRRRRGAWDAFFSFSHDAVAQASHTMRDILAKVIAKEASNERIENCSWYTARKAGDPKTKPSMRDRIRYLLYGASRDGIDKFELDRMEQAVAIFVNDDSTLKSVAHGSTTFPSEEAKLSMQNIEELLFLILRKLH